MRVLVTGMTPNQCGRPGRFALVTVASLYAEMIEAAGHQVEHRATTPDEDLTSYDVILVGLVPPGSIAARHIYPVMDVIHRAESSGAKLMYYVDDWQFYKIHGQAKVKHKNPAGMYNSLKGRTHRPWAETDEGRRRCAASIEKLAVHEWDEVWAVAYPWGDHSKIEHMPSRHVFYLDPSALCWDRLQAMVKPVEIRERRWVLASLANHQNWISRQQFNWPVELIGPKQTGAERTLKEPEIVQLVAESRGTLCPPYNHSGSGWWRIRFMYTTVAGAVSVVDPGDAARLGEAYQVPVHEIEAMTDAQLDELARAQYETLRARTWSREQLVTYVDQILRYAVGRNG